VIDGEAVILGPNGMSDFNALHSRKQNHEVQLCALLAMDGEDLRSLPLSKRKTNLSGFSAADRMASSSARSRAVRSDLISSAPPATWALKGWCQSAAIGLTAAAGQRIGTR
jgi:bifunctional non-homologous end joining protein LigD